MGLRVLQIPVWTDNYIYLLRDEASRQTAALDPAEAGAVNQILADRKWALDFIFNTHHHFDHVGGNLDLKKKWGCQVFGYGADAQRIPGISRELKKNERFLFGETALQVLFVPGHTLGHIAFWSPGENVLFCGDTLFAMGCGRLFEGSPEQMFESLSKIKALPEETLVYCAHEYTEDNARFALTVDSENPRLAQRAKLVSRLRSEGRPTVPFRLGEERETNPFLRAGSSGEFARLRRLKDQF